MKAATAIDKEFDIVNEHHFKARRELTTCLRALLEAFYSHGGETDDPAALVSEVALKRWGGIS